MRIRTGFSKGILDLIELRKNVRVSQISEILHLGYSHANNGNATRKIYIRTNSCLSYRAAVNGVSIFLCNSSRTPMVGL